MIIDRLSIEPSRRCSKGCHFCYNGSSPSGGGSWDAGALVGFVRDCAAHGVRAVSFGGGEPLEWPEIFPVLTALRGAIGRALTTHGRPLDEPAVFEALRRAAPDKIHVSIHAPENRREVELAIGRVLRLADAGLRAGVNLLVRRSRLPEATQATRRLHEAGVDNRRIVFLPLRGPETADTPTAEEVAAVAGAPFQSMSCLRGCAASPRFVSVGADRTVAWCSYTTSRAPLTAPTHGALLAALAGLGLRPCAEALVRLGRGRERSPAAP